MSIEAIPEVSIDSFPEEGLLAHFTQYEEQSLPAITITASLDRWERVKQVLLAARGANLSVILLLKKSDILLDDEEILYVFAFLRDWDQLILHNILEICEGWIPQTYLPRLQAEAKIELKWFQEWQSAIGDVRLHRYPGLPWRSFIRKVVTENFGFAMRFLELISLPATSENVEAVQAHFNAFLEAKKKVVCTFPKRWNKVH